MSTSMDKYFGEEGALAEVIDGYEVRPPQAQIAQAIADAIEVEEDLVAEAGTGTGKTLGYLVPLLDSGLKVVVSTGTKNLQEQIVNTDGPLLREVMGEHWSMALMKGRSNYLCHVRADRFARQKFLPNTDERLLQERILDWRVETTTGDRAELDDLSDDSPWWREVSATTEQCSGRKCSEWERCWVTRNRQEAQNADLVIVNHHLYLSDASLRMSVTGGNAELIPRHDYVVFDEAHDLDEIASRHFGADISEGRFISLSRDLKVLQDKANEHAGELSALSTALELRCRRFFESLPFGDRSVRWLPEQMTDEIEEHLGALTDVLERLEECLSDQPNEELGHLAQRAGNLAFELNFAISGEKHQSLHQEAESTLDSSRESITPFVRCLEMSGRSRRIVVRPLDPSALLDRAIGDQPKAFVSATLTIGRRFDHFKAKLGLRKVKELIVDSPFDYMHQMRLYLANDLPPPNSRDFAAGVSERVRELVSSSRGGAFVLCTSHYMVQRVASFLEEETHFTVLRQGNAPKSALLRDFRTRGDAVLVATMSFWQGVDVPGDALRLVIIDKIPFASPDDPVLSARMEWVESKGQSSFGAFQLPQAALLLRQGVGRLIRRRSDWGMVAILDQRVLTKGYGRVLLNSLPRCPTTTDFDKVVHHFGVRFNEN